jgi:hypothetical protein
VWFENPDDMDDKADAETAGLYILMLEPDYDGQSKAGGN